MSMLLQIKNTFLITHVIYIGVLYTFYETVLVQINNTGG